jgi:hypothetical protein
MAGWTVRSSIENIKVHRLTCRFLTRRPFLPPKQLFLPLRSTVFFSIPTFFATMFNKATLLFFALVASSVVAGNYNPNHPFSEPSQLNRHPAPLPAAPAVCDQATIISDIADLQNTAQQILAVSIPLPDP